MFIAGGVIAFRYKSRFALWLFNIGCKELFKARLTEQLLHGCDTKQLLFVRVKTGSFDSLRYSVFAGISAVGATLDQLPASPFFTADCLLECILLDIIGSSDQFVDTGEDDFNFRILQQWWQLEIVLCE